jgi:hypothetical protein
MKKRNILITISIAAIGIANSCSSDFLEVTPNGSLDQTVLISEKGVDNLLIGAYSLLDGVSNSGSGDQWDATNTNWLWGSVRGLEANKGSDAGDQPEMNPVQTFSETATNGKINNKWRMLYEGIARCNSTIQTAKLTLDAGGITQEQYDNFVNQARVLRGFYHFEAWRFWEKIPYLDETTDPYAVTNQEDVREKIIADLTAGTSLPLDMGQIGRWNKTVSQVMLAKALMQMNKDYDAAITILKDVEVNGKRPNGDPIGLAPTYGEIFDIANRNGIESIYTVQYSVNDGSGGSNAGGGEVLNFPYKGGNASPGGCCGFFIPNQEYVNTFRTEGGLPLPNFTFDTPANAVKNDQGIPGGSIWDPTSKYAVNQGVTVYDPAEPFKDLGYVCIDTNGIRGKNPLTSPANWQLKWTEDNSLPVDPRLDWSVGRRGIPFWDWGVHTGGDWIRDQSYSGPFTAKKQVYKKSQQGQFTEVGNWTSGWTSNGYRMIRYADVLLMIAECDIFKASPDLAEATDYINMVRHRAANAAGFVKESDNTTDAATYEIAEYPAAFANQDEAFYALQIERKLELGLEGHRYFDLNRWGVTVTELNRVLNYQKTLTWGNALYGSAVVGPEDVTYPVPQRQIDLSNGNIIQNR